jgi:hypothetical protein
MTAVAGSACTIGRTSTRPPPNRRRRDDPVREVPVRPLPAVRVESAPVRLEGEVATVDVRGLGGAAGAAEDPAAAEPAGLLSGAIPQVSQ